MLSIKQQLFSMILLAGVGIAQAASPWLRSEGEKYYWAGINYSTGDQRWDNDSDLEDAGCRNNDWYTHQKIEYGYSYYHTLVAGIDAASVHCGGDDLTGVGDLTLGIRGRLDKYSNGKSWEITAIIPTGYDRNDPSRLGNGRLGIEGGLAWLSSSGEAESSSPWYWGGGGAVRLWRGPPADQFLGYLTVHRRLTASGGIGLRVNADISLRNESPEKTKFENRTRLTDFDKINAKFSWSSRITPYWSYQTTVGHVLWGRNARHNLTIGFNISRHWNP